MSLKYRFATGDDLNFLVTLENLSFSINRISRKCYLNFIKKQSVLIAETNNQAIGSAVILKKKNSSKLRLYSIAISHQFAGVGYGKSFIDFLKTYTLENGLDSISLEVNEKNAKAINLYYKSGFIKIKEIPNYYSNGDMALKLQWLPKSNLNYP